MIRSLESLEEEINRYQTQQEIYVQEIKTLELHSQFGYPSDIEVAIIRIRIISLNSRITTLQGFISKLFTLRDSLK